MPAGQCRSGGHAPYAAAGARRFTGVREGFRPSASWWLGLSFAQPGGSPPVAWLPKIPDHASRQRGMPGLPIVPATARSWSEALAAVALPPRAMVGIFAEHIPPHRHFYATPCGDATCRTSSRLLIRRPHPVRAFLPSHAGHRRLPTALRGQLRGTMPSTAPLPPVRRRHFRRQRATRSPVGATGEAQRKATPPRAPAPAVAVGMV